MSAEGDRRADEQRDEEDVHMDPHLSLANLVEQSKITRELLDQHQAALRTNRESETVLLCADYLTRRIIDLSNVPRPTDFKVLRFAKELDAFEIDIGGRFSNDTARRVSYSLFVHRNQMRGAAVALLRALDDADQIRFTCEKCFKEQGFFEERGFRRCNACGYPSQ